MPKVTYPVVSQDLNPGRWAPGPMLSVIKLLCLPREKTSKEEYVGWRHNKKGKEMSRKMIKGSSQITSEPAKLTNTGCA